MLLWIIYFWLISILVVFSAAARIYLYFTSEWVKIYDLVESLISVIAIAGLYGFAYQTPILSSTFWKIIWVLLMLTWLWNFFAAKNNEMIEKIGMAKGLAVLSMTLILGVPALVGLCFYCFRSPTLWK